MTTTICGMGAMLGSCQEPAKKSDTPKSEILYVMPAESSPHEGTWLQWPHKYEYGVAHRDRVENMWVAMAREIVSGEKLHIIAFNDAERTRIISLLDKAAVSLDKIDFYLFKTNDVWVRDNGPIFVRDTEGKLTVEGWGFNGWGDKAGYDSDDLIPKEIAMVKKMPFVELSDKLTIEGGAFEVDGQGSFMATRSSIINKNRNPGMTQQQIESLLTTYLGVTHFIWLDGVAGLEITDMHIDALARFGDSNTIITMNREDLIESDVSQEDIDYLYSVKNRQGNAYDYKFIPLTRSNVVTSYGKDIGVKGSYINYYITNDKVLVPIYNDPNDTDALTIIQSLYPTRKVVGIDARNVYANGGMIHCVTQQQPR